MRFRSGDRLLFSARWFTEGCGGLEDLGVAMPGTVYACFPKNNPPAYTIEFLPPGGDAHKMDISAVDSGEGVDDSKRVTYLDDLE